MVTNVDFKMIGCNVHEAAKNIDRGEDHADKTEQFGKGIGFFVAQRNNRADDDDGRNGVGDAH